MKVKGKVTNIQTLKELLTKAKAERAERGGGKFSDNADSAESRTLNNQRESRVE